MIQLCRCSRRNRKAIYLTGGGLLVFLNKEEVSRGHSSCGYEPLERTEVSPNSEGPNIRLLSMLHRVNNSLQQKKAGCSWCKERLHSYLMNRCIREPYVQWCERRTSSPTSGEAAYSIVCSPFDHTAFTGNGI